MTLYGIRYIQTDPWRSEADRTERGWESWIDAEQSSCASSGRPPQRFEDINQAHQTLEDRRYNIYPTDQYRWVVEEIHE